MVLALNHMKRLLESEIRQVIKSIPPVFDQPNHPALIDTESKVRTYYLQQRVSSLLELLDRSGDIHRETLLEDLGSEYVRLENLQRSQQLSADQQMEFDVLEELIFRQDRFIPLDEIRQTYQLR